MATSLELPQRSPSTYTAGRKCGVPGGGSDSLKDARVDYERLCQLCQQTLIQQDT